MKYRVFCNACDDFVGETNTSELSDQNERGDSKPFRDHLEVHNGDRSFFLSYSSQKELDDDST